MHCVHWDLLADILRVEVAPDPWDILTSKGNSHIVDSTRSLLSRAGVLRIVESYIKVVVMEPLALLSVIIPAKDEQDCIASTVEHLFVELRLHGVPHEIVVVDDGSSDNTWHVLQQTRVRVPTLVPVKNNGLNGFGRAVVCGLDNSKGDAVVIMMADESDDCRDVVTYWNVLNDGFDCAFGSRFVKGGGIIDYPQLKLALNRFGNFFIRMLFRITLNDTTNAFKAYRRSTIDGCRPFLSPHFNLTIEIPLKAIVRGYTWKVVPITWRNRRTGAPKLKIK